MESVTGTLLAHMPRPLRRLWRTGRCFTFNNWHSYLLLLLITFLVITLQMNARLRGSDDKASDYKSQLEVDDPDSLVDPLRHIPLPPVNRQNDPNHIDIEANNNNINNRGANEVPIIVPPADVRRLPVDAMQVERPVNTAGQTQQLQRRNVFGDGRRDFELHHQPAKTQRVYESRPFLPDGHPPSPPPPRAAAKVSQSSSAQKSIDGVGYPILNPAGSFIPIRRWVHLDLKGGAYRPHYFFQIFAFLKKINANGVVIEWEDMFPFEGTLAAARNGDAYTMEQVEAILLAAKEMQLEIVPLVQTFGHLEWVLKLDAFAHLREDPRYLNVICFGSDEAWSLLEDMVGQVATVHQKFGLHFFHMGADEVYHVGVCNDSIRVMEREHGRERAMLWHMSRTAKHIKEKYGATVLAWHDMFVHGVEADMREYGMFEALEPVLWSYAEDLDQYLPYTDWLALKPFKNVWAASAFKGADHHRSDSNPIHYIRNHESWIVQMSRVYKDFDYLQGLIMTGWSRYDHMAVMCELMPVAIPSLVMSMETVLAGRPLGGHYEKSYGVLKCSAPYSPGYVVGCQFPGARVYELLNEYGTLRIQIQRYLSSDHELNGWMSIVAAEYNFSSPLYAEKVLPMFGFYLQPLERIERDLREEMSKIFFNETVDEYIFTYLSENMRALRRRYDALVAIVRSKGVHYPRRPFISYPSEAKPRPYPGVGGGMDMGGGGAPFIIPPVVVQYAQPP